MTASLRGTGALARLLEPIATWARRRQESTLRLEVHEDGRRAISA